MANERQRARAQSFTMSVAQLGASTLFLALAACTSPAGAFDAGPNPYPRDAVLRFNAVQAKGSHNSYHLALPQPVDDSHRYSHASLDVQLRDQGVRQLELDLHYRVDAGFEVFHLPSVDPRTTCLRFTECLTVIKTWSDTHPWHLPLTVWLEPKDDIDSIDATLAPLAGRMEALDAEIEKVWPRARVLTPDELRGDAVDLPTALRTRGWPTLSTLRGRVVFLLLDDGAARAEYTAGHPALEGRLMFVESTSELEPFAAFFKINDAVGDAAAVRTFVEAGFIVSSTVDSAADSAAANEARRAASLPTGIHFANTDFAGSSADGGLPFELPDGRPARCNPVTAPAECTPQDIEAL